MLKFEPITFMTVKIGDEKHTLVRDELMKNESLALAIELYEELYKDLEKAEYERTKLLLAFNAQRNHLMNQVNEYAQKMYGEEELEEELPKTKENNKSKPRPPKSQKMKESSDKGSPL